jgi:general secretion pathway protein K
MTRGGTSERGFALLIVLWTLTLLTMVAIGITAAGRGEVRLAENLRNASLAEAAADGGTYEGIFRLVTGQWVAGEVTHRVQLGDATVTVRIDDEAGRVNPNNVPRALMTTLLRDVGADPATAASLALAMEDYHQLFVDPDRAANRTPRYRAAGLPYGPPARDFRDVSELRLVLGMTPSLYARLAPHLSIWKPAPIALEAADPVVAAAFEEIGPNGGFDADLPTIAMFRQNGVPFTARVTAGASLGGARFTRVAVVAISEQAGPPPRPPPYQILSWRQPED